MLPPYLTHLPLCRWILRDQPNDESAGNDVMTQQFLRAQPAGTHIVPLMDMIELSGGSSAPDDKVQLTLMRHARGRPLVEVWRKISLAQRESYIHQLADIIRSLRQFTAPRAQKVDGSPLDDCLVGFCIHERAPSCTKIGPNADA